MDYNEHKKELSSKIQEIDVIGVIQKVLQAKKTLAIFVVIFALWGVVVALNTPKEYTSQVILAPEISGAGGMAESLSSLASMVGVNLNSKGSSVDAIYPEIYPDVMSSNDFIISLFNIKVRREKEVQERTYYDHLTKDLFIPFWAYPQIMIGKIFASKKNETVDNTKINNFQLTQQQNDVCNNIRSKISCLVDKKTSIITLNVKDNDRRVAAIVADTIQKRLQQYITLYRTKKARNDLAYTQKLFKEAKERYIRSQQSYGAYADANEDLILQSFQNKKNAMENEMQLRYNIYTQVSQQLQLAQAKVQERTPVFTVIQSASIPLKASSTPRSYIVFIYTFLGVIADIIWVLWIKDFIQKHKS